MNVTELIARYDPRVLLGMGDEPAPIETNEIAWAIPQDVYDRPLTMTRVAVGTGSWVHVPLPKLLRAVLVTGAGRFALAHSHPSGDLTMSEQDRRLTRVVLNAATSCGLVLTDHYIVSPYGTQVSLVDAGALQAAPISPLADFPQDRYTPSA